VNFYNILTYHNEAILIVTFKLNTILEIGKKCLKKIQKDFLYNILTYHNEVVLIRSVTFKLNIIL